MFSLIPFGRTPVPVATLYVEGMKALMFSLRYWWTPRELMYVPDNVTVLPNWWSTPTAACMLTAAFRFGASVYSVGEAVLRAAICAAVGVVVNWGFFTTYVLWLIPFS